MFPRIHAANGGVLAFNTVLSQNRVGIRVDRQVHTSELGFSEL
jgi:hypothetical protein